MVMAGSGLTVTLKVLVLNALTASRAVKSNENGVALASAGAVPLKPPAAVSVSQTGRFGLAKVTMPVPPLAANCAV